MIKAIDPNQLLAQMRALQAQATQSTPPAISVNTEQSGRVDFTKMMENALGQVNETQQAAGKMKTAFELGDPKVNLADVMIASQKASVEFEATMQVRNKLISAYEEVMRMSI